MKGNNTLWTALKAHWGHSVVIAQYGDPDDPDDVCLECEDCGSVILDAGLYALCAADDHQKMQERRPG